MIANPELPPEDPAVIRDRSDPVGPAIVAAIAFVQTTVLAVFAEYPPTTYSPGSGPYPAAKPVNAEVFSQWAHAIEIGTTATGVFALLAVGNALVKRRYGSIRSALGARPSRGRPAQAARYGLARLEGQNE